MRVAAIYDVHGNLPALAAVLTEVDALDVDAIVAGGDVASGPGLLTGVGERGVICGHTHVQFDRAVDGIRVVNAGSVGFPYEAEPAAYWALLDNDVELRRTDYDIDGAVAAILATGYPRAAQVLPYLTVDAERSDRMSALIEGLP
jgi:predicted phosphodiesterase